jgi:hypothetical protein
MLIDVSRVKTVNEQRNMERERLKRVRSEKCAAVWRQLAFMRQLMDKNADMEMVESEKNLTMTVFKSFDTVHYEYDDMFDSEEEWDRNEEFHQVIFEKYLEFLRAVNEYKPGHSAVTSAPDTSEAPTVNIARPMNSDAQIVTPTIPKTATCASPDIRAVPSVNPSNATLATNATLETCITDCPPATPEVTSPNTPCILAVPKTPDSKEPAPLASPQLTELGAETPASRDDPVSPDIEQRSVLRVHAKDNDGHGCSNVCEASMSVPSHTRYKSDRHYWQVYDDLRGGGSPWEQQNRNRDGRVL